MNLCFLSPLTKRRSVPFVLILIIYSIFNIINLLNAGVFWDDWTLFNTDYNSIHDQFHGNGLFIFTYFHAAMQSFSNPGFAYRLLMFVLQVASLFVVYKTIIRLRFNSQYWMYVLCLMASLPFFATKNTMICTTYAALHFIFLLATYFSILAQLKKSIFLRVLSLFLFFTSFTLNSHVMFYIIPFAIICYTQFNSLYHVVSFDFRILRRISFYTQFYKILDYIFLPLAFLVFKSIYMKPTGVYAISGYNKISIKGLLTAIWTTLKVFWVTLKGLFIEFVQTVSDPTLAVIGLVILGCVIAFNFKNHKPYIINNALIYVLIACGCILFFIGAYPYNVVSKTPSFLDYNSRHQLLLPLGCAVIMSAFVFAIKHGSIRKIVQMVVVVGLGLITFKNNVQYLKGNFRNQSLMAYFKVNTLPNTSSTILVHDNVQFYSANQSYTRFYAYNGMYKLATGKQNVLIIDTIEYNLYKTSFPKYIHLKNYKQRHNMKDYAITKPTYDLVLNEGSYKLTAYNTLKLLGYKYFNKTLFNRLLNQCLEVEFVKVNDV